MDLKDRFTRPFTSRDDVWDFIRAFASHWASSLSDHDGWSDSDLDTAQQRLNLILPPAIRDAYKLFGKRADLTSNHDKLLSPTELYIDEAHEALVFRHENQDVERWGILLSDIVDADNGMMANPDPAVYSRVDLADKRAESWQGFAERFSLMCVGMVMWEALNDRDAITDYADEGEPGEDEEDGAGIAEVVARHYPELDSSCLSYFEGARWFATSGILACVVPGGLYVRASSQENLELIRERVPADWLMGL